MNVCCMEAAKGHLRAAGARHGSLVEKLRVGLTRRTLPTTLLLALGFSFGGCHAPGTGENIEGVAYFRQGQPQAAIQRFQQAIVDNPSNPDAYYNLAAAYHQLGKQTEDPSLLQQAESLYHQCLDLSPDHVACHRGLAVLLVDSDRAQSAFTLLERWAQRSPHLSDPRIELARLSEEFDRPKEAERYLTEAIDVDPNNPRAWAALAHLREQSGQLAQALTNYQQAYYLNAYQPGVGPRIARLQQELRTGGGLVPLGQGTRMAENPTAGGWTHR